MKASNIYAYYVKNHHAIKVGFGDNSSQRMRDYAKAYKLDVDNTTLKTWAIPVASIAQTIESACHTALIDVGFQRVRLDNEGPEPQEIFQLESFSYAEAVMLIAGTIDQTITEIQVRLGGLESQSTQSSRRKKEENFQLREALKEKKKVDFDVKVNQSIKLINEIWRSSYKPFIDSCNRAREVMKSFPLDQNNFRKLFLKPKSNAERLYEWDHYKILRPLIIEIFHSCRAVKIEYFNRIEPIDHKIISEAERRLNISTWNPDGWCINRVDWAYGKDIDMAFLEVTDAVASGTRYLGSDQPDELINLDQQLLNLVEFARKTPPPELNTEYLRRIGRIK